MSEIANGTKHFGSFSVDGKDIHGELILADDDTKLSLKHAEFFTPDNIDNGCVHGVLSDLTHVSLFDCLAPRSC